MRRDVYVGLISTLFVMLFLAACFAGCTSQAPASQQTVTTQVTATLKETSSASMIPAATAAPAATGPRQKIVLATTTSLYDTGLLNYLEPKFESQYNVDLQITSQGTGKAIELAKRGDADILMVHSPTQEMTYVEGGNGLNRRTFRAGGFRLSLSPSYVKLCEQSIFSSGSSQWVEGMYLPAERMHHLLGPDGPKGPRGGSRLTYANVGRYLNSSLFFELMRYGHIGSGEEAGKRIAALMRSAQENGTSLMVGAHRHAPRRKRR